MTRSQKRYTEKQRQIAYYLIGNVPVGELSLDLGVPTSTLRNWMSKTSSTRFSRNLNHEVDATALRLLPRWAIAAFAARCARRVLPFLTKYTVAHIAAQNAVEIIEKLSSGSILYEEAMSELTAIASVLHNARQDPEEQKLLELLFADGITWEDWFHKCAQVKKQSVTAQTTIEQSHTASRQYAILSVLSAMDCAENQAPKNAALAAQRCHDATLHSVGYRVHELDHEQWRDLRTLLVSAFREQWDADVKISLDTFDPVTRNSAPLTVSVRDIAPSLLVPPDQIANLPDHGLLAVATRQVSRIIGLLPDPFRREAFEKISKLQGASALGYGDPLLSLSTDLCQLGDAIDQGLSQSAIPYHVSLARSIFDLGRCTRCVWADSYEQADSFFQSAIVFADRAARESGILISADILQDIAAANNLADQMRRTPSDQMSSYGNRRRREPFRQDVFAAYTRFDLGASISGSTILEICPLITDELIARLAEQPHHLYQLPPRAFEELVAKVFELYGFDVEVTQQSRDSGRDVIAISHDPTRVKYLIECKRYAPTNKVGIAVVQRLHGVLHGDCGTRAILATTSSFTKPAEEYMNRPNVQLEFEGRAFDGIHSWLVLADRIAMARRALHNDFQVTAGGVIVPTGSSAFGRS